MPSPMAWATLCFRRFRPRAGPYPTILYVAENRTNSSSQLSGVRLVNAASIPVNGNLGSSVATPNPLYVIGTYNPPNSAYLGTTPPPCPPP